MSKQTYEENYIQYKIFNLCPLGELMFKSVCYTLFSNVHHKVCIDKYCKAMTLLFTSISSRVYPIYTHTGVTCALFWFSDSGGWTLCRDESHYPRKIEWLTSENRVIIGLYQWFWLVRGQIVIFLMSILYPKYYFEQHLILSKFFTIYRLHYSWSHPLIRCLLCNGHLEENSLLTL